MWRGDCDVRTAVVGGRADSGAMLCAGDVGGKVTIGQAIVTVALLAQMYGVDPALLDCIVYRESSYNVASQNGIHTGLAQWNPSTREWLAGKAATDPLWLHGNIGAGPVQDVALAAFWMARGMGPHWSTWELCGGG